jgi:hypothetical protein
VFGASEDGVEPTKVEHSNEKLAAVESWEKVVPAMKVVRVEAGGKEIWGKCQVDAAAQCSNSWNRGIETRWSCRRFQPIVATSWSAFANIITLG